MAGIEHAGFEGRLVGVVGEEIPTGKDQVVEIRQGNEVLDLRNALVGSLAEPDGSHLRERADRGRGSAADRFNARNHGGCHGTEAHRHNTQFSFGFSYRKL